jgi:peroxiredoxin
VKLSGKITNPTNKFVEITDQMGNSVDTLLLDENNMFAGEFELKEASYHRLNDGNESTLFYLCPGDDINITLDTKEFDESVKYTGKGAANCNYLAEKYLFNERNNFNGYNWDHYKLEKKEFLDSVMYVYNLTKQFLAENLTSEMSPKLINMEQVESKYDWASFVNGYNNYHAMFNRIPRDSVNEDFSAQLDTLDLNNENNLGVMAFEEYIRVYTWGLKRIDSAYIDVKYKHAIYNLIAVNEHFTNEKVKNFLYNKHTKDAFEWGIDHAEPVVKVFDSLCTDPEIKAELHEVYNEHLKLKIGNPSPKFAGKTKDGKVVSIDDFKGKYIYIDVWATGCGPCVGQIPYMDKLIEDYEGKNIEFVSLSVDTDKEHWKNFIEEKEMKGHQLLLDNAFENSFMKEYKIRGIPQFIIVDPEGNIYRSNAPRPANKRVRTIFDEVV